MESVEYYDSIDTIQVAAQRTAALIKDSEKPIVAFTGAGISVSAGIPDYRGTAGVDTLADLGHTGGEEDVEDFYSTLTPTECHKILSSMHQRGQMHYVITQVEF